MDLARFSDYDAFAYLASGLSALIVWDICFSTQYVLGASWTIASSALVVAGAYIIGQILAAPSGWLIERNFVRRVLLRPSVILLESTPLGWRSVLKKTVLQDYYSPLDSRLQRRIRERMMREEGSECIGESLFWCAFPVAKRDSNTCSRMESFLRLYGFCRNMAFVGLSGSALIAVSATLQWTSLGWNEHIGQLFRWSLLTLTIGLGMLHRYLKFFRLYSVEVLVAYGQKENSSTTVKTA